ncbi:MAG: hypothetical protein GOVbin8609_66 [Prokaryotic dsDNA virus sp.]|nr:MAG: hypothetical protein GOVbin8609_66 [Prokaryotic dsDNA virus sp.]|tara:strand:- start:11055 stop:11255 length:201 start_codon:yes stop_codon:yes gene_type:complete
MVVLFPINIVIELEALKMEAEGMKEENKSRLSKGYSHSYNEHHFYEIAKQIRNLKYKISDDEPELL